MIVRIFGESQYRVPDSAHARLQELDNACVKAVAADDEQLFHATYDELLALVRSEGEELADDELVGSDLMLPPADVTIEEAQQEFTGEGLIPD
jgi:hypothetical protein